MPRSSTAACSPASCGGLGAGPEEVIDCRRISARAFLFTASAVPAAAGAALSALRVVRSEDGPPLLEAVLARAERLRDGLEARGFAVVAAQRIAAEPGVQLHAPGVRSRGEEHTIVTPIVPVLVGDDWKAAVLWKALYDAGVFVNTALHPAVPPRGALLRTSVMATHDDAAIDPALDVFAAVKEDFEAEHGPLPGPGTH